MGILIFILNRIDFGIITEMIVVIIIEIIIDNKVIIINLVRIILAI